VTGAYLFLLIVYASTWALYLSFHAAAATGSAQAVYAFLFGTVWTPSVAALILSASEGRTSCIELLGRLFRRTHGLEWFVIAAVLPCVAVWLATGAAKLVGDSAPRPGLPLWPSIVGMQLITGAVGEELGWRGFLLPRLSRRFGFTSAAILGGVLWSGWHIAGTLFQGLGPQAAPLIPFLAFVAVFGVFLAFVFARTGHVLASMVAHLSLNVTTALAGIPLASGTFWWALLLGFAVAVTATYFTAWPANTAMEPTART